LDEPTNHLDIKTIEYVENYIGSINAAVIIVTHDRYILNSVCSTIWELDRGHFYSHPGSYECYLERRAERIEIEQKEQDRLQNILRRELIWLARGPQARTGKDKNRKERIENMLSEKRNVQDIKQVQFSSLERRLGKKILNIEQVGFSYDDRTLFKDVTYEFKKGDRIGLVGDNGSGKSTFLDIITGVTRQTEGKVDVGVNTCFGYYDQLGRNLDTTKTALEYINEIGSRILMGSGEVSSSRFLEIFGFPVSRQRTEVSVFSGGEKRRLYLLSKIARNPNFLVLDEPTNDLDIKTMENLEEYISSFPGCVLIVSHDRAFLDCTCDMLLVLEDEKIKLYPGHYSQYRSEKDKAKSVKDEDKTSSKNDWKQPRKTKGLTFKEKKEFEALESEIEALDELISRLEESFSTTQVTEDGTLQERTQKYEKAKADKEEKEERWLILAEKE
nr:ABC-F family ATP-binding cassette domain-containing protein [Sphaerochaetaceae bacterium]